MPIDTQSIKHVHASRLGLQFDPVVQTTSSQEGNKGFINCRTEN